MVRSFRHRQTLVGPASLFADELDQGAQPGGNMPPSGEIERQTGIGRCPIRQDNLKPPGGYLLGPQCLADIGKAGAGQPPTLI